MTCFKISIETKTNYSYLTVKRFNFERLTFPKKLIQTFPIHDFKLKLFLVIKSIYVFVKDTLVTF